MLPPSFGRDETSLGGEMRNLALMSVVLFGCPTTDATTKTGDTGTTPTTDTDTDTTPTTATGGFDINGVVLNISDPSTTAAAGSCVALVDPSPALQGKPAEVIAGPTKIGEGGTFSFAKVFPPSTLGLLLTVDDCNEEPVDCAEGTGDALFTAATGIQGASFIGLGAGDVLDAAAFAIDCTTLGAWEASASGLYKGDLSDDGFMVGFVWDTTNTPIEGATVSCGSCTTVFYQDPDFSDGLFTSAEVLNGSTIAAGGSLFLIPAAAISSYSADDGGTHTFTDQLLGSNPASAVATVFFGE
jgi:hypothetical protein